jgi:hypothetical protein
MLQAGRSRVRVLMKSLDFLFNLLNPSCRTMALWFTQPLTELSTRNLPGGKGRKERKADKLTATYEQTVQKMLCLDVSQPYWHPRLVTGIALLLRLAPSKGPSRVGVSVPSLVDGKRSSFRRVVFSSNLEFRTMDIVQKPSDSEWYTPPPEPFRFYHRSCS